MTGYVIRKTLSWVAWAFFAYDMARMMICFWREVRRDRAATRKGVQHG